MDIRKFFVQKNAVNFINTQMMIRHATAFGLYMVTIVIYFAALCYWGWVQTADAYDWVMITGIVFNIGSLFSQVLLCAIIWDLGAKTSKPKPTSNKVPKKKKEPAINKTMQKLINEVNQEKLDFEARLDTKRSEVEVVPYD